MAAHPDLDEPTEAGDEGWSLEIHHLDVGQGDATLILVYKDNVNQEKVPERCVLVDGGIRNCGDVVSDFFKQNLPEEAQLDVMISTHYDGDHLGGLIKLLSCSTICNHVKIFDQGWPDTTSAIYTRYLYAIIGKKLSGQEGDAAEGCNYGMNRTRPTRLVHSELPVTLPTALALTEGFIGDESGQREAVKLVPNRTDITKGVDELVGKDVMWYDSGPPSLKAPSLTCIAANKYVIKPNGPNEWATTGLRDDPNQLSLAFLLEFNKFRYYLGGDIETTQELEMFEYLQQKGQVHAMKTSHHGSKHSTSRAFVDQLRPLAAFISCGNGNIHGHPHQEVINVLEGFDEQDFAAAPEDKGIAIPQGGANSAHPPRPSVENFYMTTEGAAGSNDGGTTRGRFRAHSFLGNETEVIAGDPKHKVPREGHIVLKISQEDSITKENVTFEVGFPHPVEKMALGSGNYSTHKHGEREGGDQ